MDIFSSIFVQFVSRTRAGIVVGQVFEFAPTWSVNDQDREVSLFFSFEVTISRFLVVAKIMEPAANVLQMPWQLLLLSVATKLRL